MKAAKKRQQLNCTYRWLVTTFTRVPALIWISSHWHSDFRTWAEIALHLLSVNVKFKRG